MNEPWRPVHACGADGHNVLATIVVPSFEARPTLTRALRSALAQTVSDFEIIVIDDASTDGSWGLIKSLASGDARIRPIRNATNRGKSYGMNRPSLPPGGAGLRCWTRTIGIAPNVWPR